MADRKEDKYHISDKVWRQIVPLLPPKLPELDSDCQYMDKKEAMEAILHMLRVQGNLVGMKTESVLYKYLKEWRRTGVFDRMWQVGILTYDELEILVL